MKLVRSQKVSEKRLEKDPLHPPTPLFTLSTPDLRAAQSLKCRVSHSPIGLPPRAGDRYLRQKVHKVVYEQVHVVHHNNTLYHRFLTEVMAEWDERADALALKKEIEAIRDDLNKHHRNVNISRATGSSVAIATGVPAAACAIAAPFTFGVTLIPAIVLGIIAAVGGGVSIGASVAEMFIKRHNVKEVQARWETFRQKFFATHEEEIAAAEKDNLQNLNAQTSGTSITTDDQSIRTAVQGAGEVVRTAGGISSAVVRGVLRTTSAGIRVTAPLLSVVSAVAIPLDIYDLVTSALRLRRGAPSTASKSLTQIIEFLDNVANGSFHRLFNNDTDIETALGLDNSLDSGNDSGNDIDHGSEQNNDNENDSLILDSDDFLCSASTFDSSVLTLEH
ncbi:hypothetical protein C0Q70_20634 [Pomacea canaliculata]|uniref:Apolipoprotein L3 n=1 Tax=Pomacea canaliculata TaxID=400727 RepID=A0A2T7NG48_POMCA|nr:hypothetical protein C0Q70_20634 [Pomacea canaliculata]